MSFLPFNRTYRHIRRYQQIIRILMKYGFDDILAQLRLDYYLPLRRKVLPGTRQKERLEEFVTRPQRIRKAFEELGPTFIKLGQLLSVRPDLIPADYATEFSKLLDEVPTFSSQQARKIIEHELRKPVESCFKSFDSEPISAASIAQVHHAISEAGDLVVVKIQRPNIEKTIEEDILILYDLAYLAEKYLAESQIVDPVGIVDEFAQTIRREIDFIREGHNIERFGKNFSDDPTMYVPTVYWEFSTRRVLTMERIEGIKLNQLDPAQFTEEERKEIAVRGANSILREIFEHGFFHADPHPANIFLLDGLVIAPVDFGIMGTIDEQTKDRLSSLLRGVVDKDVNKIIRSFYNLGYLDYNFDTKGLQREIYEYIDRYHGLPLEQIDPTQNIP
nr:hypothetical protein [Candidatus Saccharibacteria bacterium]